MEDPGKVSVRATLEKDDICPDSEALQDSFQDQDFFLRDDVAESKDYQEHDKVE